MKIAALDAQTMVNVAMVNIALAVRNVVETVAPAFEMVRLSLVRVHRRLNVLSISIRLTACVPAASYQALLI